jgi:hypothetical protein
VFDFVQDNRACALGDVFRCLSRLEFRVA